MAQEVKKTELVFIPVPGVGHITSTIEVAKLLTEHNQHVSVTVLVMRTPTEKKSAPKAFSSRLRFVELQKEETFSGQGPEPPHKALFDFIDQHKPHVREIVGEIKSSKSSDLAGIVIDMFCTSMIDVANEFGIPSYLYYTSGAAMLGLMFRVQSLRDDFNEDVTKYHNSDAEMGISTYVNPVPAKVLPSGLFENGGGGNMFIDHARRYRETKGIIINTFQELESHALQALWNDITIPPVYAIGPVLKLNDKIDQNRESKAIMNWLDLQPDSSVIFLCFGSMGTFGAEQVKEIAYALERSGYRFLWSLRKPAPKAMIGYIPDNYENLEEVLPHGFLQRTAEVGKIIGWAPQTAILSHPAVGGFISHCGWNSTLESIWYGVPMAGWPLFAEQQVNTFLLVKDLELGVEIKMDYVIGEENLNDIISADVIDNAIQKLMNHKSQIRKNMKEMKEKSRQAIARGGSASASLKSFLKNVIQNMS